MFGPEMMHKDAKSYSPLVPDLLVEGLDLVFCGTALGFTSAKKKAYYAHPGNRFWPTLFEVGLTPTLLQPVQYPELLNHRIGLTDLIKTQKGNDKDIKFGPDSRDNLLEKIELYRPNTLAFTSKKAASIFFNCSTSKLHYGEQKEKVENTAIFVLPSSSGAAIRHWDIRPWVELKRRLNCQRSRV